MSRIARSDINDSGPAAALRRSLAASALTNAPHGLPTVMASPPTTTLSSSFVNVAAATAGSTITGARLVPTVRTPYVTTDVVFNTETYTFFGQPINQHGPSNGNRLSSVGSSRAVSGLSGSPYRVEFNVDAPAIELMLFGANGSYRLWVDDQLVTRRAVAGPTNDAGMWNLRIDFGSRAVRRITMDATNAQGFAGVLLGPTDSIWPSTAPIGPRFLALGDSYGDGANGVSGLDTHNFTLGLLLGCRDIQTSAIGGTGLLAHGGGANSVQSKINYRPRLRSDVISHKPDIILIQGSVNDSTGTFTGPQVEAEMIAVTRELRESLPNAVIITTGILKPTGALSGTDAFVNHHLRLAASVAKPDLHIDAFPDFISAANVNQNPGHRNWFWGNGTTAAPNGSGNADLYMSGDSVHPSAAGHDYLAMREAAVIVQSRILSA